MTVAELIEQEKDSFDTFEVWKYLDKTRRLHTDFIKNLDEEYGEDVWGKVEVKDFYIMDEEEYDETILINSSERADFTMWYGKKDAKVLVILLDYNVEL